MREHWEVSCPICKKYKVSNLGRVKTSKSNRLRTLQNCNGYSCLTVRCCGKTKGFFVHRLVAAAFIGPCPDGKEVNHKDSDRKNNKVMNLEYVTRNENMLHAKKAGRILAGDRQPRSKLTQEIVVKLRKEFVPNKHNVLRNLISKYKLENVNSHTIWLAVKGRTWKAVEK